MSPVATTTDGLQDLNLLRDWREPISPKRFLLLGIASVLIHVAILALLASLPAIPPPSEEAPVITADLHKAVHLVAPRFYEPTQKEPNKGKVIPQLDVRSALPVPERPIQQFRPPSPPPGAAAPTAPAIEAPNVETQAAAPPPSLGTSTNGQAVQVPPPAPPPKPKLAFESVGSNTPVTPNPHPQIALPKTSIEEATKMAARAGGAPGGGLIVGDLGDNLTGIPSPNQSASRARVGSNLQLRSDPQGVDFKPYLIEVLASVRRNWLAIIPEIARMGRRGLVVLEFSIDRQGAVPKLVIMEYSGTEAFDRAAVASVNASYPFPPLPQGFQGERIVVDFKFAYNVPTR